MFAALGLQLIAISVCMAEAAQDTLRTGYHLGPGDVIQIDVAEEPEMSVKARIQADGKISYAFVGEILAQGLSVKQLEKKIYDRLIDGYLKNPKVSISVLTYRMFYINGEVSSSGGFAYQPGLTVRKAVALAGGFTERANEDGVTVIRGSDPEQQQRRIALDSPVFPDDILTVPEGFW
ncbi:polysaccharide biosynthesis/export family protein [Magnetofaba australis]|uniref:Putative polysaccharide export protein n=1 Tax=Magnetofaba australis IT-1 TaxID=1434232 RepID=A0A1Y2K330_9PROT|nr:polysaccharide biosynthesis/export family protein [Magnetofaba australis]OSM02369.1 putative polysaccharide export protein [Magnetofaba australis IT-1]